MFDYEMILPKGEENAIKAVDLAARLGFNSTRQLQESVARARAEGQMILSSGKGYYLPSNDKEVQRFIKTMESRALNTLVAIKNARQYLKIVPGQMELTS